MSQSISTAAFVTLALVTGGVSLVQAQRGVQPSTAPADQAENAPLLFDAIRAAQAPARRMANTRPEAQPLEQDAPGRFLPDRAPASSRAFEQQPQAGRNFGFDPYKDAFGTETPNVPFDEIMRADQALRPQVTANQQALLEARYDLTPVLDPAVTMTRGKPVPRGPTRRLGDGITWEDLGALTPDQLRAQGAFPYAALPHPKQMTGGQVFPQMQTQMFPRLERFDVEFDLPEAFLPEFPPAIFLRNRPELGDVSRGQIVSINNYYALFKDLLTPVQLDGLRLLVTPFPQEEFNPTDDRKTVEASLGVTCLDCHVNGHTTGQFHLNPDTRPQHRRMRLDTTSLRGVGEQQIHGSKRSLRSVEDFTEFEQRTAYFNGDQIHAIKKGMNILDRIQVSHMAQFQNMLDFPPAPKLDTNGLLKPELATESELRGQAIFFGKGQCANCHKPPYYLDHQMHDLHLERFLDEPGDGPIKTFTLRGIKDSPPYLHDGRCLTLDDTVEFFNIVLQLRLTADEKKDLTAFMLTL